MRSASKAPPVPLNVDERGRRVDRVAGSVGSDFAAGRVDGRRGGLELEVLRGGVAGADRADELGIAVGRSDVAPRRRSFEF